jgi:hypothetical protein
VTFLARREEFEACGLAWRFTRLADTRLARLALARVARLRRGLAVEPAAMEFPDGVEEVQHGPLTFRKIPLVHPHVVSARARATKSFRVEYHSVF